MCKNGEEISISQVAKILKVSKEDIAMALEAERPLESIDEENYEDDSNGESKISRISDGKDEASMLIDKICINELIEGLESREKQIILLRYYRGKTQAEVAKILGVTQVQISRIEKKILSYMKEKILYDKKIG